MFLPQKAVELYTIGKGRTRTYDPQARVASNPVLCQLSYLSKIANVNLAVERFSVKSKQKFFVKLTRSS